MLLWQELVLNGLNVSAEFLILSIAVIGSVILLSKDIKIGMMLNFTIFSAIFMWFYMVGMDWTLPLYIVIFWIIAMALSIIPTEKTSNTGGFI